MNTVRPECQCGFHDCHSEEGDDVCLGIAVYAFVDEYPEHEDWCCTYLCGSCAPRWARDYSGHLMELEYLAPGVEFDRVGFYGYVYWFGIEEGRDWDSDVLTWP